MTKRRGSLATITAAVVLLALGLTPGIAEAFEVGARFVKIERELELLRGELSTLRKGIPADLTPRLERIDEVLRRLEEDLAFLRIQLKKGEEETDKARKAAARASAEMETLSASVGDLRAELDAMREEEAKEEPEKRITLRWLADVRLRGEILDDISDVDPDPYGPTFLLMVRARLGAVLRPHPNWSVGVRFTTRSGDPRILEVPLAGATDMDAVPLGFDRAYVAGSPTEWLHLSAGMIENPLWTSGLMYDPAFPFSGGAVDFHGGSDELGWRVLAAATMLHQSFFLADSAMGALVGQAGLTVGSTAARLEAAVAYHEVMGEKGLLVSLANGRLLGSSANLCVDSFSTRIRGCGDIINGSGGLASDRPRIGQWRNVDVLVRGTFHADPWEIRLFVHGALNLGKLDAGASAPIDDEPLTRLGIAAGFEARHRYIEAGAIFSYIGPDAVLGAFRDDNQLRPGPSTAGTNLMGPTVAVTGKPAEWARIGLLGSVLRVANTDVILNGYEGWGFDVRLTLEVDLEGVLP